MKIVLNRFNKSLAGPVGIDDAEEALGRKFDFIVHNDYRTVCNAQDLGVALSRVKRKTKVNADIRNITDGLLTQFRQQNRRIEPGAGS
ncbi:MAG: hypothetical protein ACE5EM_06945 [Sphingomonadales bacterium]